MNPFLNSLFGNETPSTKIFEAVGAPMPNFKIEATHVRFGKRSQHYILDDGSKLASVIEKWQFKPGDVVGRCGYDYQMVLTNGELVMHVSICFICKTLIVNHTDVYRISKKRIMDLMEEDFKAV
ncbi:MAG: hypothetical protein JNJ57_09965 [Saprospiraceae bacterium]|nr:hypothetical protein [Saprospiraceae bacterium]